MMKIAVVGTGHLADATRECCAKRLELSTPKDADIVWFCEDMPVSTDDESDVEYVMHQLARVLVDVLPGVPVLISTQVPVGFCAKAEAQFPEHHLAIQPENIRKAHAVADFQFQNRIVCGTRHPEDVELIERVLRFFTPGEILFMSPESAEMTKHALNAFLANEIAFANEIADICVQVEANIDDVFRGFRSDRRVGNGPLVPGGPYRGGTLGRDVRTLINLGVGPLLRGISESNSARL